MFEIKNITILGAGNLGSRIGLQAAISGLRVVFYDVNEAAFIRANEVFQKILKHLVKTEMITTEETSRVLSRIFFTTDPAEAVHDADFISESVIEELTIKQKVWEQFGKNCPSENDFHH